MADHEAQHEEDPLAAAAAAGPLPGIVDDPEHDDHEEVVRHQDTGVIPIEDPDLDPEGVAQDGAGNDEGDETVTAINMRS